MDLILQDSLALLLKDVSMGAANHAENERKKEKEDKKKQ